MANRLLSLMVLCGLLSASALAQKQSAAENDRQVLQEILQQTYQPSLVGKQLMGFGAESDIRRAGTIVVIQRPGLYGSLLHNEPASSSITGTHAELFRGHKDYEVPVGERYYVTALAVSSSTVVVGLISARSIPTQAGVGRLWTTLSFNFPEQVLATADKEAVFREFDQWFIPEGRGVTAPPAAAAAPAPVAAPVAAAPAATATAAPASASAPSSAAAIAPTSAPASAPPPAAAPQQPVPAAAAVSEQGSSRVNVQSDPIGAEIYMDDQMVGSTPSTLMIPPGRHTFRVHASGHPDWTRQVNILPGSEITLSANLDKN